MKTILRTKSGFDFQMTGNHVEGLNRQLFNDDKTITLYDDETLIAIIIKSEIEMIWLDRDER